MVTLAVKVIANSAADQVMGWHGDALKVRVRAKAIKGQANKAVCKLLAQEMGIAATSVSVKSGATATRKVLNLEGVDETRLRDYLSAHPSCGYSSHFTSCKS